MRDILFEIAVIVLGSNSLLAVILKRLWENSDKKDMLRQEFQAFKETLAKQSKSIEELHAYCGVDTKEQETMRETLKILSYDMLCNKLLYHINKGYANKAERDAITLYLKPYKSNGWNGDLNAILNKFNELPFNEEEKK